MGLWTIVAAVSAGVVLAGVAYIITHPRKTLTVTTTAHGSDGIQLATSCTSSQGGGLRLCRITVRNTASREITSQARVETSEGSATSNEVSTSVPVIAKEVCLHIQVMDGDFVSVPEYEDGKTAPHVRSDRELIVFLGDMQPTEEISLQVKAQAE